MGIQEARAYLASRGRDGDIVELDESSATVALAAKALGTEEGRIAKSLSFMAKEGAIMVLAAGDMKIDNRKYRDEFGCKATMLSPDEVRDLIGHEVGGVCPFGIREGVPVYLDLSLRKYDHVYPACGSSNSAIKLSCQELEELSGAKKWVDVCKPREAPASA
jgi:prolyl-tRNA editing enzyme YbaK/EbsC (Cys-tRNA(Pro) deacylase)